MDGGIMLGRTWITLTLAVALPLALGACGGNDDDGGGTTDDTGPGGGGGSVLAPFEGNDWYGTCTRGDFDFPCEADLELVAGELVGTMDVDGVWEVVIVDDGGNISGTGTPFFGDDVFTVSDLAIDGDGNMTGNWVIDYGGSTAEGTLLMGPDGPQMTAR
jgi:hypothetical protein